MLHGLIGPLKVHQFRRPRQLDVGFLGNWVDAIQYLYIDSPVQALEMNLACTSHSRNRCQRIIPISEQ